MLYSLVFNFHGFVSVFVFVFATVVSRPPTLQPLTGPAGVLKRPARDQQTIEYITQVTESFNLISAINQSDQTSRQ